jgi:hypothetical protein
MSNGGHSLNDIVEGVVGCEVWDESQLEIAAVCVGLEDVVDKP